MSEPICVKDLLKEKWELESDWKEGEEKTRRLQAIEQAFRPFTSLILLLEMKIPNPE